MGLLQGTSALITGGSRGIGEAIVRRFAQEGADVAFTYASSKEKAEALAKELTESFGVKVKVYQSDAGSYEESEVLIKDVLEEFGKIDSLVNNAGITRDNLLLRMSEEQWDEIMATNLKSVFNLSKHIARPMMMNRKGSIINISSIVGIKGQAGQTNYAASKAGIIGFSKSLADELGSRNVRCNVIAPGFIVTDMTDKLGEDAQKEFQKSIPLKRLGLADEVANVAVFLASDLSSYVTAQVLSVCGGLSR